MSVTTIKVDALARVEGEGALHIRYSDAGIEELKFKIFEPPRFFEAFLQGRHFMEVPDITARICGICPVAYQMSSCHAMENAYGVKVDGQLRELRRLLYCGEWIESHVLHIYMLHAPDFLGYESALHMTKEHGEVVQQGLKLKKIGNDIMALLAGREIHPINVRVGGFYKAPEKSELMTLRDRLLWARDAAVATVRWCKTLPIPEFERDYEFVALHHPDEYALNEGRLISNKGLDIAIEEYDNTFVEEHDAWSNALRSHIRGRGAYLAGPLARYTLNYDQLPDLAKELATEAGLGRVCSNPFQSILVRGVETIFAVEESLRIIENYEKPDQPCVQIVAKAASGSGCTEAPRGILYHGYSTDAKGLITQAKIVAPTSQNQRIIEEDLWQLVEGNLAMPKDELTWRCEQAIRNYDPCISCATHFLKITLEPA